MKISELKEIESRPITIIASGSAYYDRGDKPCVVHICDRHGKKEKEPRYQITQCNRVMHYAATVDGLLSTYKLCARCGTPTDFRQALTQYKKWREAAVDKMIARREAIQARREKASAEKAEKLKEFIRGCIHQTLSWEWKFSGPTCTVRTSDAVFKITCEEILKGSQ